MFKEFLGKPVVVTTIDNREYIGIYNAYVIMVEGEFMQVNDLNRLTGESIRSTNIQSVVEYIIKEEE